MDSIAWNSFSLVGGVNENTFVIYLMDVQQTMSVIKRPIHIVRSFLIKWNVNTDWL